MAQEEVVIKVGVDAKAATSTVASLRKELKLAQDALLNGDGKAAKRVSELTSKLQDLEKATKTATSSGIENLNSSWATLQEGFQNADFGKITNGFKGISAAMSALPILLIVQGFNYLIENWEKVIAFGKELFDVFSDEERAIRKLNAELEIQKETTKTLTKELSREIEIMEAQGKSHKEILEAKKKIIQSQIDEAVMSAKANVQKWKEVQANDSIYESTLKVYSARLKSIGLDSAAEKIDAEIAENKLERSAEFVKATNESIELIKDLKTKLKVEEIKLDNETTANWKKNLEERNRAAAEAAAYNAKRKQMEIDSEIAAEQYLQDQKNKIVEEGRTFEQAMLDLTAQQQLAAGQKEIDEAKRNAEALANAKLTVEQNYFNAAKSLSETLFTVQLNRAKGNEKAEMEIKKRMFQTDKAFSVARAVQDGIRSVQGALAQTAILGPYAQVLAISNGVLAAANIAKILATKFDAGTTGGGVDLGSGGGGVSLPSNNVPQINTQAPIINPTTSFNNQGQNMNYQRVYVVEKDITDTQARVAKLEDQRTI